MMRLFCLGMIMLGRWIYCGSCRSSKMANLERFLGTKRFTYCDVDSHWFRLQNKQSVSRHPQSRCAIHPFQLLQMVRNESLWILEDQEIQQDGLTARILGTVLRRVLTLTSESASPHQSLRHQWMFGRAWLYPHQFPLESTLQVVQLQILSTQSKCCDTDLWKKGSVCWKDSTLKKKTYAA